MNGTLAKKYVLSISGIVVGTSCQTLACALVVSVLYCCTKNLTHNGSLFNKLDWIFLIGEI